MEAVALTRPYGVELAWHREQWLNKQITVLITQRKTFDLTRLCVESLLRFYPDIPILAVDGDSNDESLTYLRWKQASVPNFRLWERKGQVIGEFTSHGITMNQAIRGHINTKYVLLMDSDVIMERSGVIEGMLAQIQGTDNMYATGTLMIVSDSGEGCSDPKDDNDILRYAHPSLSLYNADTYKEMNADMGDYGAPCYLNMRKAKELGYVVGYFPTDKYASHVSGSSWTTPRTVWANDFDTFIRPFITFVTENDNALISLRSQTSNDFEIVTALKEASGHVILHENLIDVDLKGNYLFSSRFNLRGEYVCVLNEQIPPSDLVYLAKLIAIDKQAPDSFGLGDFIFTRRRVFQNKNAFSNGSTA